jgi:hypothetical protein
MRWGRRSSSSYYKASFLLWLPLARLAHLPEHFAHAGSQRRQDEGIVDQLQAQQHARGRRVYGRRRVLEAHQHCHSLRDGQRERDAVRLRVLAPRTGGRCALAPLAFVDDEHQGVSGSVSASLRGAHRRLLRSKLAQL